MVYCHYPLKTGISHITGIMRQSPVWSKYSSIARAIPDERGKTSIRLPQHPVLSKNPNEAKVSILKAFGFLDTMEQPQISIMGSFPSLGSLSPTWPHTWSSLPAEELERDVRPLAELVGQGHPKERERLERPGHGEGPTVHHVKPELPHQLADGGLGRFVVSADKH